MVGKGLREEQIMFRQRTRPVSRRGAVAAALSCLSRGRAGNALLLSVLILVALSAVGVMSVRQTTAELNMSGNMARTVQGLTAAEEAINRTMELMSDARLQESLFNMANYRNNPCAQVLLIGTNANPAGVTCSQVLPGGGASPVAVGLLPRFSLGNPLLNQLAFRALAMAFQVRAVWAPPEVKGLAGFDVTKDICHEIFDLTATAAMPSDIAEAVSGTLDPVQSRSLVVRFVGRIVGGPVRCMIQ